MVANKSPQEPANISRIYRIKATIQEIKKTKLKSKRGAAKRFIRTGTGAFKHRRANRSHILTKKSPKRMRSLRRTGRVDHTDQARIEAIMR